MQRFDIINNLIKEKGYKSYLEIGVQNGVCFENIVCEKKIKDLIEILEGFGVYIYVHTTEKDGKVLYQVGCVNDCYTEEYKSMEDVENCLLRLLWSQA